MQENLNGSIRVSGRCRVLNYGELSALALSD